MQVTTSHGIDWFVGGNGNTFGDHNGFRYCIQKLAERSYIILRDGTEIATAPCMADAKLYIKREG